MIFHDVLTDIKQAFCPKRIRFRCSSGNDCIKSCHLSAPFYSPRQYNLGLRDGPGNKLAPSLTL